MTEQGFLQPYYFTKKDHVFVSPGSDPEVARKEVGAYLERPVFVKRETISTEITMGELLLPGDALQYELSEAVSVADNISAIHRNLINRGILSEATYLGKLTTGFLKVPPNTTLS